MQRGTGTRSQSCSLSSPPFHLRPRGQGRGLALCLSTARRAWGCWVWRPGRATPSTRRDRVVPSALGPSGWCFPLATPFSPFLALLLLPFRSRLFFQRVILVLRQQWAVHQRARTKPRLKPVDRFLSASRSGALTHPPGVDAQSPPPSSEAGWGASTEPELLNSDCGPDGRCSLAEAVYRANEVRISELLAPPAGRTSPLGDKRGVSGVRGCGVRAPSLMRSRLPSGRLPSGRLPGAPWPATQQGGAARRARALCGA